MHRIYNMLYTIAVTPLPRSLSCSKSMRENYVYVLYISLLKWPVKTKLGLLIQRMLNGYVDDFGYMPARHQK